MCQDNRGIVHVVIFTDLTFVIIRGFIFRLSNSTTETLVVSFILYRNASPIWYCLISGAFNIGTAYNWIIFYIARGQNPDFYLNPTGSFSITGNTQKHIMDEEPTGSKVTPRPIKWLYDKIRGCLIAYSLIASLIRWYYG